jgi:hypothetical protein
MDGHIVHGEQRGVDEILVSLEAQYPTDEEEQAETEGWAALGHLPAHGIWVALATFIPTFLVIVIGVPHFLTSVLAPHATEPRVPVVPLSATVALTASATSTGGSADLRPAVLATSIPGGTGGSGRPTTLVDDTPTPRPSLETSELAASTKPTAPPKDPKPAPTEDSAWAPAAAFGDNQTAARLASTMHNQGYRVDVRYERSATRPWVVWIKASPQNRRMDEARPASEGSRR